MKTLMNTKKRILIFSTTYFPFIGGAEVAVKEITNRLGNDFDFDLITLNLDSNQKKQEKIGNVEVYRILFKGKCAKLLFPFIAYRYAVKLHKKNPYDVVWSIMASYAGFSAMFFKKKFPKIPFFLTLQEGDPIPEIKRKVFFVYPWFKQIFTLADHVQAVSNYLGEWSKEMGAKKISVIPNGVDIKKFNKNS
jgi:glycosyltransferase involved in cell wall biosynthesis